MKNVVQFPIIMKMREEKTHRKTDEERARVR